ncbi:aldo/keto reductase [Streptomyces fuscichromogenes]|uniref:NADP-dependent oxidoreductase domain-containing protein n=1 Tax=Streptomyces fuscichromogenes TaxID=1324013 RepID=A0A917XAA4_9ACTN|nr:aldo/keto reductase [Streptomyces fuscichromogenes]GGN00646.1 hypothetical protein GCM10011578_022370 [Streptomyces fuscichromogenes]
MSVSTLALGTMNFGGWGNTDRAETVRMLRDAVDAGIDFIDTADTYNATPPSITDPRQCRRWVARHRRVQATPPAHHPLCVAAVREIGVS